MFIRKTKTGTAKDGSARYSVRLVENERINGKVKQRTLLNLGRHFSIEQEHWGLLCQRVDELLNAQHRFEFIASHPQIESQARRIAARVVERAGEPTPENQATKDFQTVDVNSAADRDVRTVGVEHAALAALESLGVPQLLQDLGFNRRQRCLALATIVGRMATPASERETNRWLRETSALGEMLGIDFGAISEMALYPITQTHLTKGKK